LWQRNGREMRRAAGLVCVSECTARDTLQDLGCVPEIVRVVPNPLRPGMADRACAAIDVIRSGGVVLHVGNNGFYKNRVGVLRIFAKLDPSIACRLLMAGPAPTVGLLRLAQEHGLADRIEWCGDPDDDALASLYRRASVLLFPSLYEGFGWPVLEAMAFGLPVVASDAGSLSEVIGAAGVCLPLDDEAGFVSAINRILGSRETAIDLTKRGLARAGEFGASVFAKRMQEAYLAAIATQQRTAIDE
jgi:glycosyltransferase involved in cell wall biosynthesis